MAEHKHAAVLRAIADGVPLSEFEIRSIHGGWCDLSLGFSGWMGAPNDWEIRRKPHYIVVNGFRVPKPLEIRPSEGEQFFIAAVLNNPWFYTGKWDDTSPQERYFERGLLHMTAPRAIAHAKAMCGIDPEWSE